MVDGASSAEDSPDDDTDLSRTHTATRHRKHSLSQTAAQREEEFAATEGRRLWHIPFFITSSYYTCTFLYTSFLAYCTYIHTFRVSLLCYYSSNLYIAAWFRREACVWAMRMPS